MTYNKMFDEKTYETVNQENKDILLDYQSELKSRSLSEKSIYQYSADIRNFYCYLVKFENNAQILNLKKRTFRNFFLHLQEQEVSPARINRFQSSIRNLLSFCEDDEDEYDYDRNAMGKIKGVTNNKVREIIFLTDEQVTFLINYYMGTEEYIKALFISLAYDSCGRRNELVQVEKDGFVDGSATNKVKGKRSKVFQLIYFDRTRRIAKKYLEQRGDDEFKELFVYMSNGKKKVLSYESAYNWFVGFRKVLKDGLDVDVKLTPHSMRHSGLTNFDDGTHNALKEMGKDALDLNTLKLIAHHENADTTLSYIKNRDSEVLEAQLGIKLD